MPEIRNSQKLSLSIGGSVPEGSFYVTRTADRDLFKKLSNGEYCYVFAPRQIGKTSLCQSVLRQLKANGVHCVDIDLMSIGISASLEEWYYSLADSIADKTPEIRDWQVFWDHHRHHTPTNRFVRFLAQKVVPAVAKPLVIFIDEFDAILNNPKELREEFCSAIQALLNARDAQESLRKLTFCLFGVTSPKAIIGDSLHANLSLGTRIWLEDFSKEETRQFEEPLKKVIRHPIPYVDAVYYRTQGHPYMVQRLVSAVGDRMKEKPGSSITLSGPEALVAQLTLKLFVNRSLLDETNLGYAERRFDDLCSRSEDAASRLFTLYKAVLEAKANPQGGLVSLLRDDGETAHELALCGMVSIRRGTPQKVQVRNEIFARVFDIEWLHGKMVHGNMHDAVKKWHTHKALLTSSQLDEAISLFKQSPRNLDRTFSELLILSLHHERQNTRDAALAYVQEKQTVVELKMNLAASEEQLRGILLRTALQVGTAEDKEREARQLAVEATSLREAVFNLRLQNQQYENKLMHLRMLLDQKDSAGLISRHPLPLLPTIPNRRESGQLLLPLPENPPTDAASHSALTVPLNRFLLPSDLRRREPSLQFDPPEDSWEGTRTRAGALVITDEETQGLINSLVGSEEKLENEIEHKEYKEHKIHKSSPVINGQGLVQGLLACLHLSKSHTTAKKGVWNYPEEWFGILNVYCDNWHKIHREYQFEENQPIHRINIFNEEIISFGCTNKSKYLMFCTENLVSLRKVDDPSIRIPTLEMVGNFSAAHLIRDETDDVLFVAHKDRKLEKLKITKHGLESIGKREQKSKLRFVQDSDQAKILLSLDENSRAEIISTQTALKLARAWIEFCISEDRNNHIISAELSPDARHLLLCYNDNRVSIFSVSESPAPAQEGREQLPMNKERRSWTFTSNVTVVAFAPDGQRFVAGGRALYLWSAKSILRDSLASVENHTLLRHESPVRHAVFRPDGEVLATACNDGTLYLWGLEEGVKCHVRFRPSHRPPTALRWNAAGTILYMTDQEGRLTSYPLDRVSLHRFARKLLWYVDRRV